MLEKKREGWAHPCVWIGDHQRIAEAFSKALKDFIGVQSLL
jgi:hypothetical protein